MLDAISEQALLKMKYICSSITTQMSMTQKLRVFCLFEFHTSEKLRDKFELAKK